MRIVLDTNVLVSAFRSQEGASYAILKAVALGQIKPLVSHSLFLEYESVLKRRAQRTVHGLRLREIDQALAGIAAVALAVEVHFRWRPQLRDPNDELVLDAAINGKAQVLVTHNVRDFFPAKQFGISVLRPGELMERLKREH